jgi:hypothetical protein
MAAQTDIIFGYSSSGLFTIKVGEDDRIDAAIAAAYEVIDATGEFVDLERTRLLEPTIPAGEFWISVVYRRDRASVTARGVLLRRLAAAGITVLVDSL